MNTLEELSDLVVGSVTAPLVSYLYNRRKILRTYRELMKSERDPEEVLETLQLNRLRNLLIYANRWVPFYTDRFKRAGLAPEEIHSIDDIKRIPPLTRQEIIEHRVEMVDIRYRSSIEVADQSSRDAGLPIPLAVFRKHRLVRNNTSGSTGIPTVFYEDGSSTAISWAHELRLKRWFGLRPGARETRLVPISTVFDSRNNAFRMRKHLWHRLVIPGTNLSDAEYAMDLRLIEEFRPRILWGFTSALTGLANYVENSPKGKFPYLPDLVVTWAAPLYEHEEQIIRRVYGCPVSNVYGSRELGHVAATCPHGSLHINQEYFLVEGEKLTGDAPGTCPGELLITALNPSPMPFIRYQIGDVGTIAKGNCSCGRNLQLLNEFLGRSGEVYVTGDGRMISPNFWMRTFMGRRASDTIARFQVVYEEDGSICLRIVRNDMYTDQTEAELRNHLESTFGPHTRFEFDYVCRIDPQPSGKYQIVINELTS